MYWPHEPRQTRKLRVEPLKSCANSPVSRVARCIDIIQQRYPHCVSNEWETGIPPWILLAVPVRVCAPRTRSCSGRLAR